MSGASPASAVAAPAPAPPPPRAPLSVRLVEAAPGGPVAGGLLLAAAHYALFLLVHLALVPLGALPLADPYLRDELLGPNAIMSFLVGFGPAAMALSKRGARRCVAELEPVLAGDDAGRRAVVAEVASWPRRFMTAVGLLSMAIIIPAVLLDPAMVPAFDRLGAVDVAWLIGANALTGWLVGRAIAHEAWLARTFSDIGRRRVRVDLFALGALVPFARRGVQSVLLWSVAASVFSLLFVGGWASEVAPQVLASIVLAAAVTLVLPVQGVHGAVREAKRAELAHQREALRAARDALLEAPPGSEAAREAAARLPALAALEARTAALPEWPFDASTWIRFAAYVAIGLGSWVGAALVERALDAAVR